MATLCMMLTSDVLLVARARDVMKGRDITVVVAESARRLRALLAAILPDYLIVDVRRADPDDVRRQCGPLCDDVHIIPVIGIETATILLRHVSTNRTAAG